MRVTFTCEKCGRDTGTYTSIGESIDLQDLGAFIASPRLACPNCAPLTYGRLTEEMVAEALHVARFPSDWQIISREAPNSDIALARLQARFVLRLLEESEQRPGDWAWPRPERIRDWLLTLARKP